MKITESHFNFIQSQILKVLERHSISDIKVFIKSYTDKGLSEKRARWDLYYAAIPAQWTCDNIYPYANDDHIDTVLRKIAQS